MYLFRKLILLMGISGLGLTTLPAQKLITSDQKIYTQNFDGLPNNNTNWVNNVTLTHWYVARTDYPNANVIPLRATNGSYGGPHLCNFRNNVPGINRALGSIGASGVHFAWGVRFRNDSSDTLKTITISYYLEQWRKSSSANEQPIRFSYHISPDPITSLEAHEEGYSKVPFLNAISPVYSSGANAQLNGDNFANRVFIKHTFQIALPPGQEIMLKWYDEDDSKIDHGLAIDDLEIQFSEQLPVEDLYTGDLSVEHFIKSVILDIPDEFSGIAYIIPSAQQLDIWYEAISSLLEGDYQEAQNLLESMEIGYRLSAFLQGGDTLRVLSKDGLSDNYWGTYVFNPNAPSSCLILQAPHPLHDTQTGEQAAYLFEALGAYAFMVAGVHRCLHDEPSGCAGNSTSCRRDGQYVISDLAHTLESVFQVTTEVLADHFSDSRFVQLHGFSKGNNDPYFVISNGTRQTPDEDYVVGLGDYLESVPVNDIIPQPASPWTYVAPHINLAFNKLIGTTNTQGRFINDYDQGDLCSGNAVSTHVTGRFLHLEQYDDMRKVVSNYPILRDALVASGITTCGLPLGMRNNEDYSPDSSPKDMLLKVEHPNGIAGDVICHIASSEPQGVLILYALTGQEVARWNVENGYNTALTLEAGTLPSGMYMLSAHFGNDFQTVKIIR